MLRAISTLMLDSLFPPRCLSCARVGGIVCRECLAAVHLTEPPRCVRCWRPLLGAAAAQVIALCEVCASGDGPQALDAIRVAAVYDGTIRRLLLALKFRGRRAAAAPLGALLASAFAQTGWTADLIVPVPLHPARRRARGYNQAELMGRRCATLLHVPVRTDVLVRCRDTHAQVGLGREDRQQNVAAAFASAGAKAKSAVRGRRVLLIDDVTTTGSTLDAAASALRRLGPRAIWGLAVAQPDLESDRAASADEFANARRPRSAARPL